MERPLGSERGCAASGGLPCAGPCWFRRPNAPILGLGAHISPKPNRRGRLSARSHPPPARPNVDVDNLRSVRGRRSRWNVLAGEEHREPKAATDDDQLAPVGFPVVELREDQVELRVRVVERPFHCDETGVRAVEFPLAASSLASVLANLPSTVEAKASSLPVMPESAESARAMNASTAGEMRAARARAASCLGRAARAGPPTRAAPPRRASRSLRGRAAFPRPSRTWRSLKGLSFPPGPCDGWR